MRVEPTRCAIVAQSRGPSRSTTFRRASSSSSVQLAASLLWRTFAFLKARRFLEKRRLYVTKSRKHDYYGGQSAV